MTEETLLEIEEYKKFEPTNKFIANILSHRKDFSHNRIKKLCRKIRRGIRDNDDIVKILSRHNINEPLCFAMTMRIFELYNNGDNIN